MYSHPFPTNLHGASMATAEKLVKFENMLYFRTKDKK